MDNGKDLGKINFSQGDNENTFTGVLPDGRSLTIAIPWELEDPIENFKIIVNLDETED